MTSMRATVVLGLLSLVLCCSGLAGVLVIGPQRAVADEPGEVTTPPEEPPVVEPPPVVETPTETQAPPVETPVTTPPVETPPAGDATTPVEAAKGPASSGSEPTSGGGGSNTGAATTAPGTVTTHRASHVRSNPTHSSGGGGGGTGGSKPAGAGGNGGGGNGGNHASSHSGGNSQQPTVSPQGIDEGASAVSHVAAHVGEVFAEAIPTAPLEKIGTRLAAHTGLIPAQSGQAQKQAVDRIGTALGAALIGSAVAVEKPPAASHSPIPFFDPPGGKSGTIYLILIAALLLAVGALVFREVRSALGFGGPRTGIRVADERPRVSPRARAGVALAALREASDRSLIAFRRLRANAVSGVRSLF
jgi:hypothetical protein